MLQIPVIHPESTVRVCGGYSAMYGCKLVSSVKMIKSIGHIENVVSDKEYNILHGDIIIKDEKFIEYIKSFNKKYPQDFVEDESIMNKKK